MVDSCVGGYICRFGIVFKALTGHQADQPHIIPPKGRRYTWNYAIFYTRLSNESLFNNLSVVISKLQIALDTQSQNTKSITLWFVV
jgi:hypothetical protein